MLIPMTVIQMKSPSVCEHLLFKKFFSGPQVYPQAAHTGQEHKQGLDFAVSMAVNMMPSPAIWPGEVQPSLMDQEASLSDQASASVPRQPVGSEQLIQSSPASTRPTRSKSKGELVIVINEKLKNSKWLNLASIYSAGFL